MGTAKINTRSYTGDNSTNIGQSKVKMDAKTPQTNVAK